MRNRTVVFCALSLLILALAAGCSKSEAPKPENPPATTEAPAAMAPAASEAGGAVAEGKALFEQKCSVCHQLTRATSRTETKEGWTGIVKEMQGKRADWISDADAAKIVDFLFAEHGKK